MRITKFLAGTTCALSFAAVPAFSQDRDTDGAPVRFAGLIEQITVYATKNPTAAFGYPGMITIIDRDQIDSSIPSAISDVLRDVPSVQFAGGPRRNGEEPSIRGMTGERVLILLDGARQTFTAGHDGRFFLDPDLLRSVEVVRGASSALYGSGALGGVLAFRTVDAADLLEDEEDAGARVKLGYQRANEETSATFTAYGRAGDFDGIASIGTRQSGDIALGNGTDLPSDDEITSALVKATWTFDANSNLSASWQRYDGDSVEPDNGQGNAIGGNVNKNVTSDTWRATLTLSPDGSKLIDATFTPYFVDSNIEEVDRLAGRTKNRSVETRGFSADNRVHFALAGRPAILTFGGEWYEDAQAASDSTGAGGLLAGVPNAEAAFAGVFGQLEFATGAPFALPGKLSTIAGLRHDAFSSETTGQPGTDESHVSPKLALSYEPNDWLLFFGSYSGAFRAPSVNELYISGNHFTVPHPIFGPGVQVANVFVPNPNLAPEKARTREFGGGLRFADVAMPGDGFEIKVSHFESEVDGYIDLAVVTPPTFYSLSCFTPPSFLIGCNVGTATAANVDAELSGTEIEALYDSERFAIRANYSAIDGTERGTAFDLATLTPSRFSALITLKIPEADLKLSARLEVAGDFDRAYNPVTHSPAAETRDGYEILDLYATWKPLEGPLAGLRLDAGVENATDEDYERTFAGVSEAGRNFKASVSYAIAL